MKGGAGEAEADIGKGALKERSRVREGERVREGV